MNPDSPPSFDSRIMAILPRVAQASSMGAERQYLLRPAQGMRVLQLPSEKAAQTRNALIHMAPLQPK